MSNAYYHEVAKQFIEALESGSSVLQRKWEPGQLARPFNPVSGTRYRGANFVSLMVKGYEDPRWATYKQASSQGWQVRKGEKGTKIQFYKFTQEVQKSDREGKPIFGEDGKPERETVKLERPIVWQGTVFNLSQMNHAPELPEIGTQFAKMDTITSLIERAEVALRHDQANSAYYVPSTDTIHLPSADKFLSEAYYYEVVMHEFAHASGHESRLNRDIRHPFGSESYAREELRAEIASFMLCAEYGLSHSLGHHVSYVDSWVKILTDQPREIIDASRDADKIVRYAEGLMLDKELTLGVTVESNSPATAPDVAVKSGERLYLQVPYKEKELAKATARENGTKLGWDREKKLWWVPASAPLEQLTRWIPRGAALQRGNSNSLDEFRLVVEGAGLMLQSGPVPDGAIHRVQVTNGTPGSKDGAYALYQNEGGRFGGWYQNFKTGEKGSWSTGSAVALSPEQRETFNQYIKEQRLEREAERQKRHTFVAAETQQFIKGLPEADGSHGYVKNKGIDGNGAYVDPQQRLIVPLQDSDGRIWSVQTITETGFKQYQKNGRKKGLFANSSPETALVDGSPIFIAEGYATARTAAMTTQAATVAALDAYNLESVATELRAKYPNSPIIILGDDDVERSQNVGRECALLAAKKVDGIAVFPDFGEYGSGKNKTDFNDLARVRGESEVLRQLSKPIELSLVRQSQEHSRQRPYKHQTITRGLCSFALALFVTGASGVRALPRIGTTVKVEPVRGRFEAAFETRNTEVSMLSIRATGQRISGLRVDASKVRRRNRRGRYFPLQTEEVSTQLPAASSAQCLQVAVEEPDSITLPDLSILQDMAGFTDTQRQALLSVAEKVIVALQEQEIGENHTRCSVLSPDLLEEVTDVVASVLGTMWSSEEACSLIDSPYWEVFVSILSGFTSTTQLTKPRTRARFILPKLYRAVFVKDTCDNKARRYLVRIRGRSRGKDPVVVTMTESSFKGSKASSIKPASDGKFAPEPLLLMEHVGACNIVQQSYFFGSRRVQRSMLKPADLITHRNRIFVRTPIGNIMDGRQATFVMGTGISAYGVCFRREAKRQTKFGYPL